MNWRLEKHKISQNESSKFCHYFNNNKNCPFEQEGCMFRHEDSSECRFNTSCKFSLCQFKHSMETQKYEVLKLNNIEGKEKYTLENESKVEGDEDHSEHYNSVNEYDSEEEEFKCDLCGEGIEDKDDLSLHEMAEGCEFSCIPCGPSATL